MKRKSGKYTYIPKDEIAEVRTFNDVSFESDDLLDGAYVRGRKKFKHGGMTHERPMSLEEQAAESVGYDTWYAMEAVDQKELVDELLVSGMINPMFASGGIYSSDDRWVVIFENQDTGEFEEVVVRANNKKSAIDIAVEESGLSSDWEYYGTWLANKEMADGGMMAKGGEFTPTKEIYSGNFIEIKMPKMGDFEQEKIIARYDKEDFIFKIYDKDKKRVLRRISGLDFENNLMNGSYVIEGYMADGGITSNDSFKQSAIDEALKIAQFAYENDITASGNSLEKFSNKIFDASGISYAKAYLALAYQSMRNQGFADGGEISYVVKYSMKDTPEIVKEKIFTDKDAAELFHETISDDEDLVVMDLQVVKPKPVVSAPAKKSSLFASAKPVPATAAARKKVREQVQINGIADEIARYDQLKANINNAKAEQEVIGGRLKELGREKFLDLYEQRGVRPANFDLADGDQNILLEVTDKYLKVEPEKAELLRQFDGLLEEKTTYEFDSELLEKQVSDGMTIGDVVSMLIQDSKLIPDSDKANLIKAKMSMRVPKGTLDRLMQYDNPRQVFSLISPILALK
jgi:hypothetical protein